MNIAPKLKPKRERGKKKEPVIEKIEPSGVGRLLSIVSGFFSLDQEEEEGIAEIESESEDSITVVESDKKIGKDKEAVDKKVVDKKVAEKEKKKEKEEAAYEIFKVHEIIIQGVVYYTDKHQNLFHILDIVRRFPNPRVIGSWDTALDGTIQISIHEDAISGR